MLKKAISHRKAEFIESSYVHSGPAGSLVTGRHSMDSMKAAPLRSDVLFFGMFNYMDARGGLPPFSKQILLLTTAIGCRLLRIRYEGERCVFEARLSHRQGL